MKILTITCENIEQMNLYTYAGADEVITALKGACFTSMPELTMAEIKELASRNPGRTAVLMNRLFGEEEKQKAEELLDEVLTFADAVLFADPALMYEAARLGRQSQMIYRPETLMTSTRDASWWMSQGLQSVQISPLLTEDEIKMIASSVPHTGLQIHGRLLMSVSKRRLLHAYAEVNGLAEMAEKEDLYLQEESREGRMPVYENAYGTLIYTDFIQQSFAYMKDFMDAGVERFEIDANGLTEEQIQDALKIYRELLDEQEADSSTYLEKYSSLPFSTGYYGQKTVK